MSGTFTVKCRPSHVIGWEGNGPNCLLLINQSTGDLDPLQSVQREFEIQPETKNKIASHIPSLGLNMLTSKFIKVYF